MKFPLVSRLLLALMAVFVTASTVSADVIPFRLYGNQQIERSLVRTTANTDFIESLAAVSEDGSVVYPTMVADFANQRYWRSTSSFTTPNYSSFSGVFESFSRASSATYTNNTGMLQTAATNAPRFTHDLVTLQPLGLLVEESQTNLVTRSESFSDTVWVKTNFTPVSTTLSNGVMGTTLPDSGWRNYFIYDNTNAAFVISQTPYTTQSTAQRFSVTFVTPVSCTSIRVGVIRRGATENSYQNVSVTPNTTYTMSFYHQTGKIGGVQLEATSAATSYIPTAGSTVTRAADDVFTDSLSWFNPVEGTFIAQHIAGNQGFLLGMGQGTTGNPPRGHVISNVGLAQFFAADSTNSRASEGLATPTLGQLVRTGATYSAANFRYWQNGAGANTAAALSSYSYTRLAIGRRYGLSNTYANTTISLVLYYPKRLTNAEVQRLTNPSSTILGFVPRYNQQRKVS